MASTRDEPKNNHSADGVDILIYTDRSGKVGRAGAGVVLYRGNNEPKILHFHLGSLKHHTTYKAEAVNILLGAHLLEGETDYESTGLYINNQVVIQATSILHP